ncbi:hypothetical protein ACFP51_34230 [Streptomyces pratens]|uniref:Uncharacterized protein n=1 Tax=Streptomyces pratens TaxID=887456 RepID=A0ABW1LZ83_9ACTN
MAVRGGSETYAAWSRTNTTLARDARVLVVDSISARSVIVEPLPS